MNNKISMSISIIALLVSLVSLFNNMKQTELDLLAPRYEIYGELENIEGFLKDCDNVSEKIGMNEKLYKDFWMNEFRPNNGDLSVEKILENQIDTINKSKFLFSNITKKEVEQLKEYLNNYKYLTLYNIQYDNSDSSKKFVYFEKNAPEKLKKQAEEAVQKIKKKQGVIETILLKMEKECKL